MIKKYFFPLILSMVLSINVLGQTTFVPDNNFEQALINLGFDDELDDYVLTSNISNITNLNISNKGISSLVGIQNFTSLTSLRCDSNQISSLDLSTNLSLTELICNNNQLVNINLIQNQLLSKLICNDNNLTSINLIQNTLLLELDCKNNQLTNLILNNNGLLTYLNCRNNNLDALNVTNNQNLIDLSADNNNLLELNLVNNQTLKTLNFSNNLINNIGLNNNLNLESLSCANNLLSNLNIVNNNALKSLSIGGNIFTSVDISNNTLLESLYFGGDNLNSMGPASNYAINITNNTNLETIVCNGSNISEIDISNLTSLKTLGCANTNLTDLDLSNNIALESINCGYNNLTSLTFGNNPVLWSVNCRNNNLTSLELSSLPQLAELICWYNNITELDISNNPEMIILYCSDNNLSSLNLRNGNNEQLAFFSAYENPNLYCIQIDDIQNINDNWFEIDIDSQSYYSEICGLYPYNVDSDGEERQLELNELSIASDGSSATIFKYPISEFQDLEFSIKEDLNSDFDAFGSFEVGSVINDTLNIVYNHPKYFSAPTPENLSNQFKDLTLKIYNLELDRILGEIPIKLVRPSLLMVHGIWSEGDKVFSNMVDYLQNETNDMYNTYQLKKMNYLSDQSNAGNNSVIFRNAKDNLIERALENNTSLGKLDVVAHSNGGLLTRYYIQNEYYQDDINKLITLNTPHSGSQMANALLDGPLSVVQPVFSFLKRNPNNGIIEDLKVDSPFITSLNNYESDTYQNVGLHSIYSNEFVTTAVFSNTWSRLLPIYYSFIASVSADVVLATLFDSVYHDLVVSQDSQIGGLAPQFTSFFDSQMHVGSAKNILIIERIGELLNENPQSSNLFSLGGYNPITLVPPINSTLANRQQLSNETIGFTLPVEGSEFNAGQEVVIDVTGSSGVENIVTSMGGAFSVIQNHTSENSNSSGFNFIVPEYALGRMEIVTVGFDTDGDVVFDSTYIIVTTDEVLQSIDIIQDEIFVSEGGIATVNIVGNYSDGITRNISNLVGINYSFSNQNAFYVEDGVIGGTIEGEDELTITFQGIEDSTQINVIASQTLNTTSSELYDFNLYPNPSGSMVNLLTNYDNGKLKIYDNLGKLVREYETVPKKIDISTFHEGIYIFEIVYQEKILQRKVIKR